METVTQEKFTAFKAEVLSKRIGRKLVKLNELRLIGDSVIEYAGLPFALSSDAFKALLKISGITAKTRDKIIEKYGDDFADQIVSMLTKIMGESKQDMVMLIDMNKKQVINFTENAKSMISNEAFLGQIEKVLNDSNLTVKDLIAKKDGGFVVSTLGDNSEWGLKGVESTESFKFGLAFDNNPISGTRMMPFNQRLICTNGMMGTEFNGVHHLCNTKESWDHYYKKLDILKRDNFRPTEFSPTLKDVMKVNASVDELEAARRIIKANARINEDNIDALERFVPMLSTKKAYADKGIFFDQMSPAKKKNATTDAGYWELINGLTDFASHDYGFNTRKPDNIQRFAGQMFTGKPSLSNLIPSPF
jgi:hypothetical protein